MTIRQIRISVLAVATLLAVAVSATAQIITHPRLFSFEDPSVMRDICISPGSEVSISERHYKDGQSSLEWNFIPESVLSLRCDTGFEPKDPTGADSYLSTFVVWIYGDVAADDALRFEFLKEGKVCAWFDMNLNFKGWRAAWVCFERDMQGTPCEGMDEIRITAPPRSGRLFFDHMITAVKSDSRYQSPDVHVPFVNSATLNHWLQLLNHWQFAPDIAAEPLTAAQMEDIRKIGERFVNMTDLPGKHVTEADVATLRERAARYGITYHDGTVTGIPLFYSRSAEAYERLTDDWTTDMLASRGVELKACFDLMYAVARAHRSAMEPDLKDELSAIFLSLYDHVTDQGAVWGSAMGNITHYGYSFRNMFTSYFLMRDALRGHGELQRAQQTMLWYAMTNEVFNPPLRRGMDMDAFNTLATGRIASILMLDDSPLKVQYLRAFSRWIDNGCLPSPGLMGAFKADGGAFHHANLYPAYAVGGLSGATDMIYLLSRTEFEVSREAHSTVRNVLLAMRFYCNTLHFPLSLSGRHPDGLGQLIPIQYATMAVSGSVDGEQPVDKEMAQTYLRLYEAKRTFSLPEADYMPDAATQMESGMAALFYDRGLAPESDPAGNLAMGYGCVSVQRRSNWAVVVRGHSRYLWASEHYLNNNFYGRYLAHGSMQVLTAPAGRSVTPASSGWQEEGFDWGRIPGTTAVHLPVEQLRARVHNVDAFSGIEEMLYSDEAFAGGLSQRRRDGNFGMVLHEHDKYNGSMRARKSFHFFGEIIVCLGSDIENDNTQHATETTVLQLAVADDKLSFYDDVPSISRGFFTDHLGTSYWLPEEAVLERNFPQLSRGQKTGAITSGNWVSLIYDHGIAPRGEGYEYVVMPQADPAMKEAFEHGVPYEVMQRDSRAHIVRIADNGMTSYVLFEQLDGLPPGVIAGVDSPCLAMTREERQGELLLTVCQPDLALYEGPSDEAYDDCGRRTERSIYSRPWIANESHARAVKVTLEGKWDVVEGEAQVVERKKGYTVLEFVCRDGMSYDAVLRRK